MIKTFRSNISLSYPRNLPSLRYERQILDQEQHLAGMAAVGYSTVGALTFLLYDIMITFDDEVRLIWPNPWTVTKYLFFFIRYFPVVLQITIMFIGTPPFTFTHYECYIWNVYQAIATTMVIASVDYILILRVFAIYPRNQYIKYLLVFIYPLELLVISVGMGLSVPGMVYDNLCVVVGVPTTYIIAAGAPIVFQTLLFVLTGWKFIEAVKAGWGDIAIMRLLMRDGTWAFILLFVVLASEAALYGLATEAYSGVLYGWLNTFFSFCGYRVLLNLHDLGANRERRSSTTSHQDVEFSTHFDFGHFTEGYVMTNLGGDSSSREEGERSVENHRTVAS